MNEQEAMEFYDKVVGGTKNHKTIALQGPDGSTLEGVEMHIVNKRTLADVINRLPDELFEAVDEADNPEEAEQMAEEQNAMSGVSRETVEAFEDLCKESLRHPELPADLMGDLVHEYSFGVLFQLGTEIINMSAEDTGAIEDFHERG